MDEPSIQQRVLAEVAAERQRQDEQWGASDHGPDMWALIVAKHAGRLAADALDLGALDGADGRDGDAYLTLQQFRERCVKVAAVCVAAVESIDRANAN
jgi:hypothetical protein